MATETGLIVAPDTAPAAGHESSSPAARGYRPADGLVYVSGAFRTSADAAVSVFDHGLLYGGGIFEGIRAYNGAVKLNATSSGC
jgi:hypothetical protein